MVVKKICQFYHNWSFKVKQFITHNFKNMWLMILINKYLKDCQRINNLKNY